MRELTEQIKQIDLPALATRDYGIKLVNRGESFTGLCPFHSERNPSFKIYRDENGKWRFHCFGCSAHGDAVDFIQRLHSLDFKNALNYSGINQGPLTKADRRKIAGAVRKREGRRQLISFFCQWQQAAVHHFSVLVRATYKAMGKLTPENFDQCGHILQPLSTWEYWLDILTFGDDSEKFALFQEHRAKRIKLLQRKYLFRADFEFQQWLREKDRING